MITTAAGDQAGSRHPAAIGVGVGGLLLIWPLRGPLSYPRRSQPSGYSRRPLSRVAGSGSRCETEVAVRTCTSSGASVDCPA